MQLSTTARALFFGLCILLSSPATLHATGTAVNINTADVEALATLSGVGETRAAAIVEYREANGAFKSVDDLYRVSGVGAATVESNRARITVE